MDAIRTVNLTKKYKEKTAVDALNLTVREGELYALLGVNGAGKSTAIRMLSGLSRPTSGDALLLGHSIVTEASAAKASLSVSPQETAVAAKLSVRENLEFIAKVYGADRKEAQEKTDRILREFSLGEFEKSPARTLSGGWQRRLSIAMALISEPKILFLDEPTLGLDVLARRELWNVIEGLKGQMTLILTTHYLEEAESLADRVGIMANGRLCAEGTPEELKRLAGTDKFEEAFLRLAGEGQRGSIGRDSML